ncbi:MAG: OmpA family protein [Bacteroidota bacterium]|nr:OmpA family protein [Bacteroidota bacterium]
MKKIPAVIIAATLLYPSQAQPLKKLKQKVEAAIGVETNNTQNPGGNEAATVKKDTVPAGTTAESGSAASVNPQLKAYQNYDFIAGEKIIFEDDFSADEQGEFAAHWNLLSGQGTVNKAAGKTALLLTSSSANITPAIKQPSYLRDSFTVEFDHYAADGVYGFQLFFYNNEKEAVAEKPELGRIDFCSANSFVAINTKAGDAATQTNNLPEEISGDNYRNKWHHIAISLINKRLKIYVDQTRVLSLPSFNVAARSLMLQTGGSSSAPGVITNVRIANGGGMKTNDKKFTDAKIVTHGITFDIDKATIKPESMGVLNMIVGIMNNNPEVKFEIDGHTDNAGAAAHNLQLSQQRADAVKSQLVAMGIDAARLTSKGFGSSVPAADNSMPEGRANNRRVEFVKK